MEPRRAAVLKGKSEPLTAYRLLAGPRGARSVAREGFVGRERELALLREAWTRALAERRCELVTIVADAGLGKSRLAAEALASIEAPPSSAGRCLPYGGRDHLLAGRGSAQAAPTRRPPTRRGRGGGDDRDQLAAPLRQRPGPGLAQQRQLALAADEDLPRAAAPRAARGSEQPGRRAAARSSPSTRAARPAPPRPPRATSASVASAISTSPGKAACCKRGSHVHRITGRDRSSVPDTTSPSSPRSAPRSPSPANASRISTAARTPATHRPRAPPAPRTPPSPHPR